jgi:hypothetical protein
MARVRRDVPNQALQATCEDARASAQTFAKQTRLK